MIKRWIEEHEVRYGALLTSSTVDFLWEEITMVTPLDVLTKVTDRANRLQKIQEKQSSRSLKEKCVELVLSKSYQAGINTQTKLAIAYYLAKAVFTSVAQTARIGQHVIQWLMWAKVHKERVNPDEKYFIGLGIEIVMAYCSMIDEEVIGSDKRCRVER